MVTVSMNGQLVSGEVWEAARPMLPPKRPQPKRVVRRRRTSSAGRYIYVLRAGGLAGYLPRANPAGAARDVLAAGA